MRDLSSPTRDWTQALGSEIIELNCQIIPSAPILHHSKISLKCIKDLDVKPETMKLLEENRKRDLWHGSWIWHLKHKLRKKKKKKKHMVLHQAKKFLHSKRNDQQSEMTTYRMQKKIANPVSHKRQISKIYVYRHLSKEDIQKANEYMKRCSRWSLVIREMQIKITMRYYLTPVRMANIKKTRQGITLVVQWSTGYQSTF